MCQQIKESELDDHTIQDLAEFAPRRGLEALEQFEHADFSKVQNRMGYLGGVIARLRRQPGPKQHPEVQQRLDSMFKSRKLKASDLDARCYDTLASAPVHIALATLDRLAARNLDEIRNISAFFMASYRSVGDDTASAQLSSQYMH